MHAWMRWAPSPSCIPSSQPSSSAAPNAEATSAAGSGSHSVRRTSRQAARDLLRKVEGGTPLQSQQLLDDLENLAGVLSEGVDSSQEEEQESSMHMFDDARTVNMIDSFVAELEQYDTDKSKSSEDFEGFQRIQIARWNLEAELDKSRGVLERRRYVRRRMKLLMCGNLGEDYEDEDDCDRPRWKSFPELEGSEIRSLCSCGQNVGVITEAGDIFTWGANNFGQVGIAPEDEDEAAHVCSPCKLPQLRSGLLRNGPPRQPAQLAVGRGHMACVTTTGELFTWGCNDHGQLGRDSSYKSTRQRDQVGTVMRRHLFSELPSELSIKNAFSAAPGHALDASYRATQVACGSDWTCVVLEEEGVFHAQTGRSMLLSFGRNDKGQCGHGHSSQRADMAFVKLSGVVRTLACGEGHTICVCWGDEVYAWGANECGQLGIGIQGGEHGHLAGLVSASGIGEDWIAEPCRVESLCGRRCVMVAAGLFHSAALVLGGTVWTWGDNTYCQLGVRARAGGSPLESQTFPEPQVVESIVDQAVCFLSCGDFHTAATTLGGMMLTWGKKLEVRAAGAGKYFSCDAEVAWNSGEKQHALADGSMGTLWCCQTSCGEEHTIMLVVEAADARKEPTEVWELRQEIEQDDESLVTRSQALTGLSLILRVLLNLEIMLTRPLRRSLESVYPILEESELQGVIGRDGLASRAREHVELVLEQLVSSWERGLPNVTLKDILVREHEGFQSLVKFLDNCPAQLLAMRRALKKLRFAKFADDAGKELVASGTWSILRHPWGRLFTLDQTPSVLQELEAPSGLCAVCEQPLAMLAGSGGAHGRCSIALSSRMSAARVAREQQEEVSTLLLLEPRLVSPTESRGIWLDYSRACCCIPSLLAASLLSLVDLRYCIKAGDEEETVGGSEGRAVPKDFCSMHSRLVQLASSMHRAAAVEVEGRRVVAEGTSMSERWRRTWKAVKKVWTMVIRVSGLDSCGDLGPFFFLLLFLWFFGLPFALIYVLSDLPMYDPSGWQQVLATKVPISLYIASGFFFPLARVFRSMKLTDRAQLQHGSSSARDNFSNRLVCLALVVEAWQLVALAFGEGMPYDSSGFAHLASPAEVGMSGVSCRVAGINSIMLWALLDLRLTCTAWLDEVVGVSLLSCLPVLWLVMRNLSRQGAKSWGASSLLEQRRFIGFSPARAFVGQMLGPLFASVLFMPILARVAQSLSCSFSYDRGYLMLDTSLHLADSSLFNATSCSNVKTIAVARVGDVVPRYLHSSFVLGYFDEIWPWRPRDLPVSLCGAIPCWEFRLGSGGVLPHAWYAFIGLLAFALFFPSSCFIHFPETPPNPNVDLVTLPSFIVESQVVKAAMVFIRELYRRSRWPSLLANVIGCSFLFFRHLRVRPVAVSWFANLQRMAYLLAAWSSLASLLCMFVLWDGAPGSLLPARYSNYAIIFLLIGYATIILLSAIAWKFLGRRERSSEEEEEEEEEGRSFLSIRSSRNAAKRWWDIKGVAAPREQLGAPRIRLAAGTRARAEEMRRRFFSSWPGRLVLWAGQLLSACFCGKASTASSSYLPVHEEKETPRWSESEYLNLSYQCLGTSFQLPELRHVVLKSRLSIRVLKLAHNELRSFPVSCSMPLLELLDLAFNRLSSLDSLPQAPSLQTLNARSNDIRSQPSSLRALKRFRGLRHIVLEENPVAVDLTSYVRLISLLVPDLETLDGSSFHRVEDADEDASPTAASRRSMLARVTSAFARMTSWMAPEDEGGVDEILEDGTIRKSSFLQTSLSRGVSLLLRSNRRLGRRKRTYNVIERRPTSMLLEMSDEPNNVRGRRSNSRNISSSVEQGE